MQAVACTKSLHKFGGKNSSVIRSGWARGSGLQATEPHPDPPKMLSQADYSPPGAARRHSQRSRFRPTLADYPSHRYRIVSPGELGTAGYAWVRMTSHRRGKGARRPFS